MFFSRIFYAHLINQPIEQSNISKMFRKTFLHNDVITIQRDTQNAKYNECKGEGGSSPEVVM